jgi:carbamoyltransferase
MNVLGVSAYYHDAAACLMRDGRVVAAAEEERFTRRKHDPSFPIHASCFCLNSARLSTKDLDAVVFYEKPNLKLDRIWSMAVQGRNGWPLLERALPRWALHIRTEDLIRRWLRYDGPIHFIEHHLAHAASAFFCSPFEEAALYTVDGVGEWATSSWGTGRGHKIALEAELRFPNSLGLLYSAFTYYLGFEVNDGEYKVMGLAPYGKPTWLDKIRKVVIDHGDGSLTLRPEYFDFTNRDRMVTDRFLDLFGGPPRRPESQFVQRDWDIAMSIQRFTEEVMMAAARHIHDKTHMKNLCLAGGVALNCVANGRILRECKFERIFIQPAAGDAGGAIGAAAYFTHAMQKAPRAPRGLEDAYLGPQFSPEAVESYLRLLGVKYRRLDDRELLPLVAKHIADGKIIGWFQGRMEFGPRALGNRSILGDPRPPEMKDIINAKIKLREGFRPFAPAVMRERCEDYFELDQESPYMLLVAQVREDHRHIGAVTHLDGSARIQTVTRESNARFYGLIGEFEKITGVPVVVNTSFNIRGEPIVCTPDDAYRCFMGTGIDYLVLENCLLDKNEQPPRSTAPAQSASIAAMAVSPAVYTLV